MVQGRWAVSQVAVAVIVYGTLIRRSSGEVMFVARVRVRVRVRVSSLELRVSSVVSCCNLNGKHSDTGNEPGSQEV